MDRIDRSLEIQMDRVEPTASVRLDSVQNRFDSVGTGPVQTEVVHPCSRRFLGKSELSIEHARRYGRSYPQV